MGSSSFSVIIFLPFHTVHRVLKARILKWFVIVQEAMIKIIPKKKKRKKPEWLSEKTLQIAEKRREAKGTGEKERYPFECRVPKNSKER